MSLFLAMIANAQEETTTEEIFSSIESAVKSFVGEEIPSPIGSLYGNEVVNIYLADETPIGYAITSEGIFTDFGKGEAEEPTINVYIENGNTIQSIMEAENPLDRFYELKAEGKIVIDPVGAGKTIKFFFTNIIGKIISWFT